MANETISESLKVDRKVYTLHTDRHKTKLFVFHQKALNCKERMPLPPALAAKLAKRGILQQSDTNAGPKVSQKSAEGNTVYI